MRSCGTCSACCRWPSIPELEKPQGVTCAHLESCGHGCTTYNFRPPRCKSFECAWVQGNGHASDAPDTSGVMLFHHDSQFGEILISVDLGFGMLRPKKKAIKRIARDAGRMVVLADSENPERISLVYSPLGIDTPKKLSHLEVV